MRRTRLFSPGTLGNGGITCMLPNGSELNVNKHACILSSRAVSVCAIARSLTLYSSKKSCRMKDESAFCVIFIARAAQNSVALRLAFKREKTLIALQHVKKSLCSIRRSLNRLYYTLLLRFQLQFVVATEINSMEWPRER